MFSTLLRRLGLLPVLLLLLLGASHPVRASHLLGGEMTYKYLDAKGTTAAAPHRYEITLKVYNNCNASSSLIQSSYPIAIYNQGSGSKLALTSANSDNVNASGNLIISELLPRPACSLPDVPVGCTITPGQLSYIKQTFVAVVNLPASTVGYYAAWSSSARNNGISNVAANNEYMGLYCTMAPPALANSSPVFVNDAVANICSSDTTYILNNAVDPDGDELVYSFGTPYINTLPQVWTVPPPQISFYPGYNVANPLGTPASFPGNYANVNPATGISKYLTTAGLNTLYVIAVDVSEYRLINNQRVLIGTTRRDVQLVTVTCPGTPAPVLPTAVGTPRNYTIEAGSTLTIPLKATQVSGHPLKMTVSSVLLDSTGGFDASFNNHIGKLLAGTPSGSATAGSATGTIAANFVYNSTCTQARATPYDVVVLVEDKGCAGKTGADILHITVVKPSGPTNITGDFAVCGLPASRTYTAVPGAAPTASTINWRVVGGTIVGSNTANPVTVNWTTPGTGTIVARGVSQYGCFTDSVTKTATLAQIATLAVTGNQTICQGTSTALTVTGGTAPYTVTANGATVASGAGPFTLSPTATTSYTITATPTATVCAATAQVTVTVQPSPTANAGATVTVCSGSPAQLGAAPVAGLAYSWSPATGLSSSSIANPSLTLTNATGAAIMPTYTLTVTNPATGCVNTSTVVVTVNSEILPGIVGPSQTVCASSTPAPLSSTPDATGGYGTYAYQWESSLDNVTWTAIVGATSATYAPGPLAATTYYRRRVSSGSCAAAVSNAVRLELLPLLITGVTLATPPTQCAGLPFTFTPVPTNAGSAPSYRWFVNNAPVASGPTFTSTTLANGDVVRVEVTPTPGLCATSLATASVTVNLTLVAQPTATIRTPTVLPICAGSPVAFVIDSTTNAGTSPTYQWQVNGVNVPGATGTTFTSTTLTDGQVVTLVLTTPSACGPVTATSNGLTIGVNPFVQVNAGPDKTIMEGETVELEGTANGNFPFTWTPNLGLTFPSNNPLRPTASPSVTTTYTLATQVGNCSSESKVTITVTPRVRIPNAFTPNGDGLDDTWQIDRIGDYTSNHVIIFNRWGSKLFETTNYNHGNEWNGTINGQPAPIGTYYYLITLGNGKSYTGPLTVVY